MLAGFPTGNVREIVSDREFRISIEALRDAIVRDRQASLTPFAVVGNAGTTNTGAVDDLSAIAEIARTEKLWFHADAAYGGFFMLTERGRRRLAGMSRRIRWLSAQGTLSAIRDGRSSSDFGTLKKAHALSADFMPTMQRTRTSWISALSRALETGGLGVIPMKMPGSRSSEQTSTRNST